MGGVSESLPARAGWREFLHQHRASPRLAFLLRCGVTIAGALLSLIWARLLVRTLGDEVYGVFLAFLAIVQLGGLSEFGLSGGIGISVLNFLSKGDEAGCRNFLATARGVVLGMACLTMVLGGTLSPWAPGIFGFHDTAGAGSMQALFFLGAAGVALGIVSGYWQNLNYVAGNVVWPIVPVFLLTQFASVGQLVLAWGGAPLWAQYAVSVLTSAVSIVVLWFVIGQSHPVLSKIRPVQWDTRVAMGLSTTSLWVFLSTVGNLIYVTTDRIVINGGLGPALLPSYRFNYRLCELFTMLLASASFVALPALASRILSADSAVLAQGVSGLERLRKLQTLVCCAVALLYLGANDLFISLWIGPQYQASFLLQCCFALNFVVTVSGDAYIQLPGRLDQAGARVGGSVMALCGMINLILSLLAVKFQSLLGVAIATVVAQSVFSWIMAFHAARRLQRAPWRWLFESWAMPILIILAGGGFCQVLRPLRPGTGLLFAAGSMLLLVVLAVAVRLTTSMLRDELNKYKLMFLQARK